MGIPSETYEDLCRCPYLNYNSGLSAWTDPFCNLCSGYYLCCCINLLLKFLRRRYAILYAYMPLSVVLVSG